MIEIAFVIADGGLIGKENPSPHGLTWAFILLDGEGRLVTERSGLVTCAALEVERIGSNAAEFAALLFALEAVPPFTPGPIMVLSDSQNTLGRFFKGWSTNGVPPLYVSRLQKLQGEPGWERYTHQLLDGHPTAAHLRAGVGRRGNPCSPYNVRCDQLCREQSVAFQKEKGIR